MLENLEPKSVFSFFEEIDQIPRGSGNTQKISDYLAEFAKKRNLFYIQDTLGNVIIKKDGTAGMEEKEPVIIQGHMDMVAVKELDCEKDMETEGLDLAVQGDYVYAKGTSLGADDGIAVAYALALLDSKDIPHPPLEVIITVDEETGMFGAQGIDLSMLQGKKMLNIDSEKEDELTVACAGGLRVYANWQIAYTEIGDKEQYVVTVYGLKGGHSGVEIGLGRANANKLLCELLYLMERELDVRVITMDGGTKDNVIPHEAKAQIACGAKEEELKKLIGVVENSFREEWAKKESGLQIRLEKAEKQYEKAIDASDFFRVMSFFLEAPNGVQAMSRDLPGLVETSLNFATLHMEPEEEVKVGFSLRSSSSTAKQALKEKLCNMIAESEGEYEANGEYPSWEYKEKSELREQVVRTYKEVLGKEPKVLSIHAGLECGILSQKIEGLDCVSFGPNIDDIHTTKEKLSISSTQRIWELLKKLMQMDA